MDQKLQEIRALTASLAQATRVPLTRKELLIAESNQLRLAISHEFDSIEDSLSWVSQGARLGGAIKKGGLLLTVLSGLWMAFKAWKGKHAEVAEGAEAGEAAEEAPLYAQVLKGGLKLAGVVFPLVKMILR